jgi:hypothetical protein
MKLPPPLVDWALRKAVLLDGVYSLPYALTLSRRYFGRYWRTGSGPLPGTRRCWLLNRP